MGIRILPPTAVSSVMPRLKQISDTWLEEKNTREKGFSLGSFNENYMKEFPLGIVRKGDDIVAFVNIWTGAKDELSVDLMRYARTRLLL